MRLYNRGDSLCIVRPLLCLRRRCFLQLLCDKRFGRRCHTKHQYMPTTIIQHCPLSLSIDTTITAWGEQDQNTALAHWGPIDWQIGMDRTHFSVTMRHGHAKMGWVSPSYRDVIPYLLMPPFCPRTILVVVVKCSLFNQTTDNLFSANTKTMLYTILQIIAEGYQRNHTAQWTGRLLS